MHFVINDVTSHQLNELLEKKIKSLSTDTQDKIKAATDLFFNDKPDYEPSGHEIALYLDAITDILNEEKARLHHRNQEILDDEEFDMYLWIILFYIFACTAIAVEIVGIFVLAAVGAALLATPAFKLGTGLLALEALVIPILYYTYLALEQGLDNIIEQSVISRKEQAFELKKDLDIHKDMKSALHSFFRPAVAEPVRETQPPMMALAS